jgi:hypothetical protein
VCGIDWSALGTWAGAAAVALGVGVAFFQLRSLNANERVRATIEFLNGWTTDESRAPSGEIITPSSGANSMVTIMSTPERAAQYRDDVAEFFHGTLRRDRGDSYADATGIKTAGVLSVANYFIKAESLIRRNRLDEDLFLEQMANQLTTFWTFVESFEDVDQHAEGAAHNRLLRPFAERAAAWYRKRLAELAESG